MRHKKSNLKNRRSTMNTQKIATSTNGTLGKGFKFAAATAAVIIMTVFAAGTAVAGGASNTPQSVDVVNTPTVNVGNTPSVTVANTPSVNVANTPAVSISGTPNVNADATITAPGPLTNVGRLASQHITLNVVLGSTCSTRLQQIKGDGNVTCFDLSNDPAQALVITDTAFFGQTTAGNTCGMFIFGQGLGNLFFPSVATAAADGTASKSEHLTTGVVMTVNPLVSMTCTGERVLMQ